MNYNKTLIANFTESLPCANIFVEDHEDGDDWGGWSENNDDRSTVVEEANDLDHDSTYIGRLRRSCRVTIGVDTTG